MWHISQIDPFAALNAYGGAMMAGDSAAYATPYARVPGPEHQLDHRRLTVGLSAGPIHGGDPPLPGAVDTGIRHQQVLRLLDSHRLVRD
jgi:hypothetical protein